MLPAWADWLHCFQVAVHILIYLATLVKLRFRLQTRKLPLIHVLSGDYWALIHRVVLLLMLSVQVTIASFLALSGHGDLLNRQLNQVKVLLFDDLCLQQRFEEVLRIDRDRVTGTEMIEDFGAVLDELLIDRVLWRHDFRGLDTCLLRLSRMQVRLRASSLPSEECSKRVHITLSDVNSFCSNFLIWNAQRSFSN